MFYSLPDVITNTRATFRFGGIGETMLKLSNPATVTFNGVKLLYNSLRVAHEKDFFRFIDSETFIYTDLDDNVITNVMPFINEIRYPANDTISASFSFFFTWQGLSV